MFLIALIKVRKKTLKKLQILQSLIFYCLKFIQNHFPKENCQNVSFLSIILSFLHSSYLLRSFDKLLELYVFSNFF